MNTPELPEETPDSDLPPQHSPAPGEPASGDLSDEYSLIDPVSETTPAGRKSPGNAGVPPADDVIVITSADVLPDPPMSMSSPQPQRTGPPYRALPELPRPGVWGTVAWVAGVIGVHVVAGLLAMVVFAYDFLKEIAAQGEMTLDLPTEVLGKIVAADQIIFLFAACLALWFAFRDKLTRRVPLSLPPWRHLSVLLSVAIPMAVFNSYVAVAVQSGLMEQGGDASKQIIMEELTALIQTTPMVMLLFVIAVCPAVGEEIIFRGIIGRGLIARVGLVRGIIITSLLFAAVHLNAPQSMGVISIAVVMHIGYLATRSFWTPVIMHFVNNALAAVAMKAAMSQEAAQGAEALQAEAMQVVPMHVAALGLACTVLASMWVWQTRVQFRGSDGELLRTRFPSVEHPPSHVEYYPEFARTSPWLLPTFAVTLVVFFTALSQAMQP